MAGSSASSTECSNNRLQKLYRSKCVYRGTKKIEKFGENIYSIRELFVFFCVCKTLNETSKAVCVKLNFMLVINTFFSLYWLALLARNKTSEANILV